MAGKFELKQAKTGQFHFNLLAGNGQIILQSGLFESKASALNSIASIQKNARMDERFERIVSKSGNAYFVIKAGSHQVIGQSQQYESEAGRDNGIESVKKNAPDAEVVDLSTEGLLEVELIESENVSRIGSVRTFFDKLEKFKSDEEHIYFYRGLSDIRYTLTPSIYRDRGWIKNEDILFKELILRCPSDFDSTESTFQTLVKMQHFSLPTRLLDLTSNPLIALYFATAEKAGQSVDGEVVVFKIPKIEIKYYDSDTVSVIANISRRPADFSLPENVLSDEEFNELPEIKFLLHEIKKEKPYFQPLIKREHLESVVCVKPKLDNARIIKQDGAFFLFGISKNKKIAAEVPTKYFATLSNPLIITNEKKRVIRDQLKALGITQGTIYPDIENVANFIKEEFKEKYS